MSELSAILKASKHCLQSSLNHSFLLWTVWTLYLYILINLPSFLSTVFLPFLSFAWPYYCSNVFKYYCIVVLFELILPLTFVACQWCTLYCFRLLVITTFRMFCLFTWIFMIKTEVNINNCLKSDISLYPEL